MSIHGVPKKKIDEIHSRYNKKTKTDEEKTKDIRIPMSEFKKQGLRIGKKTTTRFIRGKK